MAVLGVHEIMVLSESAISILAVAIGNDGIPNSSSPMKKVSFITQLQKQVFSCVISVQKGAFMDSFLGTTL